MEFTDDDIGFCVADADALRRLEEYKQRRRAEKKAERDAAQMAQENQATRMKPMADETTTRIDEPTPNGGAYSIAYWKDADGNPTTKDKAVAVEIHEMNEQNQSIFRTYASLDE